MSITRFNKVMFDTKGVRKLEHEEVVSLLLFIGIPLDTLVTLSITPYRKKIIIKFNDSEQFNCFAKRMKDKNSIRYPVDNVMTDFPMLLLNGRVKSITITGLPHEVSLNSLGEALDEYGWSNH